MYQKLWFSLSMDRPSQVEAVVRSIYDNMPACKQPKPVTLVQYYSHLLQVLQEEILLIVDTTLYKYQLCESTW